MTIGIDAEMRRIMDKYGSKADSKFGENVMDQSSMAEVFSRDYDVFKKEALTYADSFYERACNFSEKILKVSPKAEEAYKLQEAIDRVHINITPSGAYAFATLTMIILVVLGFLTGVIGYFLQAAGIFQSSQVMLAIIFILGGVIALKPLSKYPIYLATKWRLQASNQMVLCILYIVMYMRHTSNLELAIKFAGEHIGNPLALDLRKIVWDVEIQRYSSIKQSLDIYLEGWKKYNLEFVESFHLIESSLYESDNNKRVTLLDKALQVMLEGTYENMLHYAQDVKSPITTLHMLGIILPVLGLIMLPLIGSFLGVKWYQLALIYNIALPLGVYFMGYKIMAKRPMGYSQSNIYEDNPRYQRMRMFVMGKGANQKLISPKKIAILLLIMISLIGLAPVIYHFINPGADILINLGGKSYGSFLDYRTVDVEINGVLETVNVGPFGIGAAMLSLFLTLGIAIGIGAYYRIRSNRLIEVRNETKKLEKEFQSAIFQLGNRVGSGIPTEMAFSSVAETLQGTPTGNFFNIVDNNIRRVGMNVQNAIFDSEIGAINEYPSSLIDSSMRVLVETSRKGPLVVSQALLNISTYLDRINKVNERLKDLLAETVGSMKAQVAFLSPVISGIVVGIGTMITTIIGGLAAAMSAAPGNEGASNLGALGDLGNMFPVQGLMPPYFFQIVVGLYLIEVVFILSILSNGIENGVDKLNEENKIGKNLYKSTIFYVIVAALTMIVFNALAVMISTRAAG
ncbi:MAG: hypothetical protein KKA65_02775 [Nanoarchaeota archaeon]|nr:hypothetical protein [Nanoarchaeota archaeon]MBU4241915.1 hypothetical protein [Nanoarchaeota archaeon]MBU4352257.1 hypothetical protein [Nanoarchaeota archaeon]MBU4456401.1 hypothetical protein [Nanoarchaeota archaeon]MCG2720200.1 hypothetical protein [Nanoarchaeota archaeon]